MNDNSELENYTTQINVMHNSSARNNERFITIHKKLDDGLKNFQILLNDELKEEFKKVQNLYKEYIFIYAHEEFCHGIYLATGVSRKDLKN